MAPLPTLLGLPFKLAGRPGHRAAASAWPARRALLAAGGSAWLHLTPTSAQQSTSLTACPAALPRLPTLPTLLTPPKHAPSPSLQDARDFGSDGYSLRVQHKFSRHIKLLICVTLYNEDQETLGKTLLGICEVRWGEGWRAGWGACSQGMAQHSANIQFKRKACAASGHGTPAWVALGGAVHCPQCRPGPPSSRFGTAPPAPVLQNLEVLYRQYGRDGNKHGLDWQEVRGRWLCAAAAAAAAPLSR